MLTQLERIDDRGIVEDVLLPRGLGGAGVPSMALPTAPLVAARAGASVWRQPSFYAGVMLMALILAATWLVRLAMTIRGSAPLNG